jgi:hypothetical protein
MKSKMRRFYLFIYGSLNDAVILPADIASNDGVINEIIDLIECEMKESWPNIRY